MGRAAGVLSRRIDSGLTQLRDDPHLVHVRPLLLFSQRTGRTIRKIRKRVIKGLVKLGNNPRFVSMRQWTGGAVDSIWKHAVSE
jgi:hypothetical protein